MTVVRTFSGRDVNLMQPCPAMFDIRDIAHHLALINRFAGASSLPYSVAQHSVHVAQLLAKRKAAPQVQFRGLMHDAHEAYMGDITRPVKFVVDDYAMGEIPLAGLAARLDAAIFSRFGIDARPMNDDPVSWADDAMLAAEWRDLMRGPCPTAVPPAPFAIRPLPWARAEEDFLECFARLSLHCGGVPPVPTGIFK